MGNIWVSDGTATNWCPHRPTMERISPRRNWDEMALTTTRSGTRSLTGLNQMAVLGQYDVKVGNHGHATVSVLDFDGAGGCMRMARQPWATDLG